MAAVSRRDFLGLAGAGLLAALARGGLAAGRRPNLLLILADDLGYGDVGCYGGQWAPTPAIDSLARDGVRCTDGYVTAPVCAPSRCGLMAGAYNQRFGIQWNDDRNSYALGQHQLLPQVLKAAGYVTGQIGKWNVAADVKQCFDETFAVLDWEADYFPDAQGHYYGVDSETERASSKVQGVWGPQRPGDEYLTDRLGRHACEFIERHRAEPFFLYLAFNAVHSPWSARSADRERFAHLNHPLGFYAAMIASLDENVGRVLAQLETSGLARDTLVVFVSDNGPARGSRYIKVWPDGWPEAVLVGSSGPLSGYKGQLSEGGIRVPYLLRWPGVLPAGEVYHQPVSTMDLYPSFCAAAGAAAPAETRLDGVDLLPLLRAQAGPAHDRLFWKIATTGGESGAVRQGDWKLLISGAGPTLRLFNLAEDIAEQHDLAAEQPERAKELHQAWLAWNGALPPRATPAKRPPQDRSTLFGSKDRNKDGKLDCDEFMVNQQDPQAARLRFDAWDLDGDNALSQDEFVRMGRKAD